MTLADVIAILVAVTWIVIVGGVGMSSKNDLKEEILIRSWVKISKWCPYYKTFSHKVGMVQEIRRDLVGPLYLVRLESGEDFYFRRAELVYLGDPGNGFWKNLSLRKLNRGLTG